MIPSDSITDADQSGNYGTVQELEADKAKIAYLLDAYSAENMAVSGTVDSAKVKQYEQELKEKYGLTDNAFNSFTLPLVGEIKLSDLNSQLDAKIKELKAALSEGGYDYDRMRGYEQTLAKQKEYEREQERLSALAKQHPVSGSLMSVAASPLQGVDYLVQAAKGIGHSDAADLSSYVPLNVYDMDMTNLVGTIRSAVGEKIAENTNWEIAGQNVAKFLYDAGMSVADSAVQVGMFGTWATTLMGMSAASNTTKEIIERGGNNQQALLGGLAAGAAEAVFEKVSIDRLLSAKNVSGIRSWLKETAKQGLTEASEEAFTEIANILSDAAIMGEKSNFKAAVSQYMAQGMSEEEAKKKAYLELVGQVAWAAAGGFVSGVAMGGTTNAQRGAQRTPFTLPTIVQAGMDTATQENAVVGVPGQNKTASTGETVNGNGLSAYSEQEITNFSSGKKNKIVSTFADAVNFIRNALSNNQSNEKAYFGKITNDVAQKVLAETGMDVAGYNAILQSDNARHIMKQHGNALNESARGQVAVTAEDIALIPQVLAAPDRVSVSPELDSRGRTVLIFEKQIGGNYVTMQAVSDGKHALQTDTLFIKKMKNSQDTGYNASQNADHAHNAQGVPPQSSSGTNIRDNSTGVKNNSAQNSDILPIPGSGLNGDTAQRPQRFAMSADGLVDEVDGYGRNTVGSAEAVSPYQEAPTQSVADRMFTEQEMQNHDLESKHQVYTNKQSR